MNNISKFISTVLVVSLAGCAIHPPPTREDANAFESLGKGKISQDSILDFCSCLYDGFAKARSVADHIGTKQQQRSNGYRIETYANGRILLISVDVLNTGHVELWEGSSAALIDTSGERNVFASCLEKYQAP